MPPTKSVAAAIFLTSCALALPASALSSALAAPAGVPPARTTREEYLQRLVYENDLMNQRLTWLLTSQSLLFAGYGVILNAKLREQANNRIAQTVMTLGASSSFLIWSGIIAAIGAIVRLHHESGQRDFVVWRWTNVVGWSVPLLLPLLFMGSWLNLPRTGLASEHMRGSSEDD